MCAQVRLTGDPYIVHCVETAAIVERLHASPKDLPALDEIDERCCCTPCLNTSHLAAACLFYQR
jgi:(p)ppGpp synthase/HD superfamily hydrolase